MSDQIDQVALDTQGDFNRAFAALRKDRQALAAKLEEAQIDRAYFLTRIDRALALLSPKAVAGSPELKLFSILNGSEDQLR